MKNIRYIILLGLLIVGIPANLFAQENSSEGVKICSTGDNGTINGTFNGTKGDANGDTIDNTNGDTKDNTKDDTNNGTIEDGTKNDTEPYAESNLFNLASDSTEFSMPAPIPLAGTYRPFLMYGITPFYSGGYANWDLHKGFNASFGMNVSVGFGKNRIHGVGFGQDAAFLYAVPLNARLSVAGGVYATNMDWGNYSYRNVGITGIAAFKATDRITIYGYGNKSLMPKRMYPAYPLPNFSPDKFGGMVNFKVGESASFSIGVEAIKNDCPYGYYW